MSGEAFYMGEDYDQVATDTGASPQIGDAMPDGTVYAGISPDTCKPFYAAPADEPLTMTWEHAMKTAAEKGMQLPTRDELDILYRNRNRGLLQGTFNESSTFFAGWYWSSSEQPLDADGAWMKRFFRGHRSCGWKGIGASVRLVLG